MSGRARIAGVGSAEHFGLDGRRAVGRTMREARGGRRSTEYGVVTIERY
jgi:hypothetical protein